MASFKVICLAGVTILVAGAAEAADLPSVPHMEAPFLPTTSPVVAGNWYLRGDVGVGISDLRQGNSDNDYVIPGLAYNAHTLEDAAIIDVGVGYRFNEYFRADLTGGYRASAALRSIESYQGGGFTGFDNYSGSISSVVGLVNGYVDVGTWYGVTLWGGAGVGVADLMVRNVVDMGVVPAAGFGFAPDHSQLNLAFALMAGLDFAVTQNLTMELGYRYLNQGTAKTGVITCQNIPSDQCSHEVQHYKIASNDIRLGFRYLLANNPPPQPQYPLIRKY